MQSPATAPTACSVNGSEYTHSVIVPWQGDVVRWQVASFDQLRAAHFDALIALRPAAGDLRQRRAPALSAAARCWRR